ncbi:hypothetical protein Hypma_003966 [Hypsizygus marmoreus]|uniref:Uncharacterized protein n=1 Tax=Hypsizygus marmoreus TaxID=39966 RepID=A0A369J3K8_HYPMA|nr:hypothetical protein Hypma_003966 [Hypsizygus marmoreus]
MTPNLLSDLIPLWVGAGSGRDIKEEGVPLLVFSSFMMTVFFQAWQSQREQCSPTCCSIHLSCAVSSMPFQNLIILNLRDFGHELHSLFATEILHLILSYPPTRPWSRFHDRGYSSSSSPPSKTCVDSPSRFLTKVYGSI